MVKPAKEFYSKAFKGERIRLVKDAYHNLEFTTTMHFLKKHLPRGGHILDAGGGPGRYTIALAKMGYKVTLLDITPENLEYAKKQIKRAKVGNKVDAIVEGSITDLSVFENNTFDAVICLGGPLSHVQGESNRKKAISELTRVAKKKAPVFVSIMSKYGTYLSWPLWSSEMLLPNFNSFIEHGDDYRWIGKYYCHFYTREQLKQAFAIPSLKFIDIIGLEGNVYIAKDLVSKEFKKPKIARKAFETHLKLCNDQFIADASAHMMIICKKI